MVFAMKRVYEPAEASDGQRVLVDRLWPRGVSKERAHLGEWLKDIAPSAQLRREWHGATDQWDRYAAEYRAELDANPGATDALLAIGREHDRVTLLYSSHDPHVNHAAVLLDWLADHGASVES